MEALLLTDLKASRDRSKKCEFMIFFADNVYGNSMRVLSTVAEKFGCENDGQGKHVWVMDSWEWACRCKVTVKSGRVVIGEGWQAFVERKSLGKGDPVMFRFNGDKALKVIAMDAQTQKEKRTPGSSDRGEGRTKLSDQKGGGGDGYDSDDGDARQRDAVMGLAGKGGAEIDYP